jgi:hypothetical protein
MAGESGIPTLPAGIEDLIDGNREEAVFRFPPTARKLPRQAISLSCRDKLAPRYLQFYRKPKPWCSLHPDAS